MKRALKVQQQPVDGKKSKSLSVVDALEKAEREEATLLQVEQAATTTQEGSAPSSGFSEQGDGSEAKRSTMSSKPAGGRRTRK
jgi:hypothetical protein